MPHHRLCDSRGAFPLYTASIHTDVWSLQLGLASDLVSTINRTFGVFASYIRPRTRYLVFCSSWTLLSGIFLVMLMALASATTAIIVNLIVYG
jgi:hypothetical protein